MGVRTVLRHLAIVLGLGAVLSAASLFVAALLSSGYALDEPQVVGGIVLGGPLVVGALWLGLLGLRRKSATPATEPVAGDGAAHAPGSAPFEANRVPPTSLVRADRSTWSQMVWLVAGLLLAIPTAGILLTIASFFRGAAHPTELGTTWHENDRIVNPMVAIALAIIGGVGAAVLARRRGSRSLAVGLAIGCVALGVLIVSA